MNPKDCNWRRSSTPDRRHDPATGPPACRQCIKFKDVSEGKTLLVLQIDAFDLAHCSQREGEIERDILQALKPA